MGSESLLIGLLVAVLVAGAFLLAWQFVRPAPPDRIRIATGSSANAYHQFALQYRELLARSGITLEVLETGGTLENLDLLERGVADLAFVQSGVADPTAHPELRALGSLYPEPLWIFTRKDMVVERLPDLIGHRLATGAAGSGTSAFVLKLLAASGITAANTTLLPLGGEAAEEALLRAEADALFLVTGTDSARLNRLLHRPELRLVSLTRAQAWARHSPYLQAITLPEGVLDLAGNIPDQPLQLIAPTATLVARADFHPALTALVLGTARKIHGRHSLLADRGSYPTPAGVDFPLSEDAARFYERGTPFLQRYLPFWAASLIDRLVVMLIPLITLMIPLMKILPPTYRWRVRSRIYRWYDELRRLDFRIAEADSAEELRALKTQLDDIETDVMEVEVPKSYADEQYNLRLHLRLIRERLERRLIALEADPS